ncbi:hypothetical protein NLU13_4428 [Sarocladium strictum]|uniref:non-specific serine/threonine protein kinase n=1 Tax=Sarocladium strictum TaxID=5046 RepID=A0AA39GK85_SARSR|nr:hypothetical protein NLU13_4428 [Sarocladium strictum]
MDSPSNKVPDQGPLRDRRETRSTTPLHTQLPPAPSLPSKTAQSTPMSSPGLFSPTGIRHNAAVGNTSLSESTTPSGLGSLHPLQSHRVRETHKANIDSDNITGRKSINQYEVIEEIGRGMHGKVKLARNQETGDNVAIKIIPRFSKKRRLGKLSGLAPQDKTKKEIAILKKIRHPNVVALLEVIDDPELKKIYMVLEHVELGEIVWRKKGLPHICSFERRRIEREMRGEPPSAEEEKYMQLLERRQRIKQMKRERMAQHYPDASDYWSVEHGAADEASSYGQQSRIASQDDFAIEESLAGSRSSSRAPTRSHSYRSINEAPFELEEDVDWDDDMETPGPLRSNAASSVGLDAASYGLPGEGEYRGRSPSMADSIISHMSSIDFPNVIHDAFVDDFSYVPCFTFQQARSTFRDTVLGLEYLHYQGVVHRDIKPANLLWTKEHRVKISDFGVSYFGRPIRDGDADDTVSESEAQDFDDDLELAKTVGTPAFFAPELCYTDVDQEQPKISEQIDVWSLGVTLYCLIYARIPFLADDEYQMFKKIATEEVYIPDRRLKPVDPSTSPAVSSLYKRQNSDPYRDDNDLEYEDVDPSLINLIQQMLIKNPEKRIRLRDIKRHPWVTSDITNIIGWLDDSDPARPTEGRKIQVDEKDLSYAVVPIAILERARTMTRKVLNKVMHPLGDRGDSRSRQRATSSAASSAGDSMVNNVPTTPGQRTERRRSILSDDYFATAIQESLMHTDTNTGSTQLDGAQTPNQFYDPLATVLRASEISREHLRSGSAAAAFDHSVIPSRTMSSGHRHGYSVGRLSRHSQHLWTPSGRHTTPTTPFGEIRANSPAMPAMPSYAMPQMRDVETSKDDLSRSKSVDRGLFVSTDKRAQPQVSLNTAAAPGSIHTPVQSHNPDNSAQGHGGLASPPHLVQQRFDYGASYQHQQPHSDPSIHTNFASAAGERPQTAQKTSNAHPLRDSTAADLANSAQAQANQYRKHQVETYQTQDASANLSENGAAVATNTLWAAQQDGLPGTQFMNAAKSSSTDSMDAIGTPLTSPSEMTSPVIMPPGGKHSNESMAAFHSDPSLPALLSGASSVSADLEAELLGRPGIVEGQPSILLETTDSLTPPALLKEPPTFPIQEVFRNSPAMDSGSLTVHLASAHRSHASDTASRAASVEGDDGDDEDDSGSDDGLLLMTKSKKKPTTSYTPAHSPSPFEPRRRDTNISIMSTDTAKKVSIEKTSDDQ